MEAIRKYNGGDFLVTASADIAAGEVVIVGELKGVAPYPIKQGAVGTVSRFGQFIMPYDAAAPASQGAKAYWKVAENQVTATASGNTLIGYFAADVESSADTCQVIFA